MHRRLQFGMRENPASDRRHGSRLSVNTERNPNYIEKENPSVLHTTGLGKPAFAEEQAHTHAARTQAATMGKDRATNSVAYRTRSRQNFERAGLLGIRAHPSPLSRAHSAH
jgi:hypothetical protein